MLKQALKAIARQNNFLYSSVFADFVAGNNPSCTQCFWEHFSTSIVFSPVLRGTTCRFATPVAISICIPPKRKCCQMTLIATDGFQPRQLKKLLAANQCWTSFLDAGGLRDIEVEAVTKMLACGTRISGVKEYGCDNPSCHQVKYITNACHSRAYPSCSKKGHRPVDCRPA